MRTTQRRTVAATRRLIRLREWLPTELALDPDELTDLQSIPARLIVQPLGDRYLVTPRSVVGAASTPRLDVVIRPKFGIDRIFFMLGYARNVRFVHEAAALGERGDIVEPFVATFLNALQRAMRRGLLMGYVTHEEALPTIRGRVRFADQARRRYGLPLPVEVSYDELTADTEANRLVKAALRRIERLRLRTPGLRRRTAEALTAFEGVADVAFDRRRLPNFRFNRLTDRYRPVLELAALIVRDASVELEPGTTSMSSLLFDMNDVFEDFVFAAIGDALRGRVSASYRWRQGKKVALDEGGQLHPEPDLSLWDRRRCVFVGDAKYKETEYGEAGDLYQLLAYCIATGLGEGLLIYAEKPEGPSLHQVVAGGPLLRVETIDVSAPADELIARCGELAADVAAMAGAPA